MLEKFEEFLEIEETAVDNKGHHEHLRESKDDCLEPKLSLLFKKINNDEEIGDKLGALRWRKIHHTLRNQLVHDSYPT